MERRTRKQELPLPRALCTRVRNHTLEPTAECVRMKRKASAFVKRRVPAFGGIEVLQARPSAPS